MKVNREKLFELYIKEINRISDLLEDKSIFEPKEIVDILSEIIEKNFESLIS